jgi:two-component system, cell cycle sensor histidine kinase and response regulator CckA
MSAPLPLDEKERLKALLEHTQKELEWKSAFLEAQVDSSPDGILVVNVQNKKILQNRRTADLLKIPPHVADNDEGLQQLQWITDSVRNPAQFIEKVNHIRSHPDEVSRDEVEFKDGTTVDRYSAPVIGKDGTSFGRIFTFRDITDQKRADNLLRQSEMRYRSLFDNARDAIFTIAADGAFTSLNPAVEQIGGIARADWIGKSFAPMVHPDDRLLALEMFKRALRGDLVPVHELRGDPSLNRPAVMEMTLVAQRDDGGSIIGVMGIGRDITERKKFAANSFRSQKLETVGKLAGGIAHEFNSILTAIIGQCEMMMGELPPGSASAKGAVEISQAANRAARLTRQLLAYGRKQLLQPEILDLNRVVTDMENVFRLVMGTDVTTQIVPVPDLRPVKADAGQIEQVIMNMIINAREAMPNGGRLTLETANVSLEEDSVGRYPELTPGNYAVLAITDTGTGMTEQVKARLFEPFFTTKAVGQGTGLGLSTCYGIIKQTEGHISVYSEAGRGSTFKIYLPQVQQPAIAPGQVPASPGLPRGTETILLVEDDPALREMAGTLLRKLGYTVWTAANGIEALNLKQQRDVGHIDLLFTDVVMPHMSGKELADRIEALFPHTKILFTSAFTESAIVHQGVLNKGVALLQKPFTPAALALKVRQVLEQPKQG